MTSWIRRLGNLLNPAKAQPEHTRQHSANMMISLYAADRAVWSDRNYAAFAREGFAENPVGYRCVKMIAEAAASVPWKLFAGGEVCCDHPVLDLLAAPNPLESGRNLMESFYSFLQISGNAYLEASVLEGVVRELHVLRPDRMTLMTGPDGWPTAWEYRINDDIIRFEQRPGRFSPILHIKTFNPLNDHYGMSPFEAAAKGVDIHNAAGNWNKALLDNAARPSGALVYGGKGEENLTTEQFDRLKRELEGTYQGSANAGRPMVLEGGLDWKPLSLSPKDMEHIEAKHVAAREIALAFGVPPMLLGIPGDNTFANYAEANRTFWRQTVLPLVAKTTQSLNQWLIPAFDEGARLGYDLDDIPALSDERQALWKRVSEASFLSDEEKRQMLGLAGR